MTKRFRVFTEDAELRAAVDRGLALPELVGRTLGEGLVEAGGAVRPDLLIVDLSHPLAALLVSSLERMADPPALLAIADTVRPCASLPFEIVRTPVEAATLARSVRTALARNGQRTAAAATPLPSAAARAGAR
jgi:hypothetical protein